MDKKIQMTTYNFSDDVIQLIRSRVRPDPIGSLECWVDDDESRLNWSVEEWDDFLDSIAEQQEYECAMNKLGLGDY